MENFINPPSWLKNVANLPEKIEGDDSQIITSPKNALTLAENEAVLIFLKSGKEIRQTIKEVKERPMLLYPSAKPKN